MNHESARNSRFNGEQRHSRGKTTDNLSHMFDSETRVAENTIHQVLNDKLHVKKLQTTGRLKFGKIIEPLSPEILQLPQKPNLSVFAGSRQPLRLADKKRQLANMLRNEPDFIEKEEAAQLRQKENNKTGDSYLPALRMFSPM